MLYNVDDDDDVPAYVILDCVSYSPNWFCTGGTDEVESWDEIETMAEEMDNFDSLVVTSIEVDNVSYNGYCWEDKIFIISSPGDNTLAHETGHLADLDDIYTSGEKDRIMFWKDYGGNELRSYEAEAYEGAAQPPEKK